MNNLANTYANQGRFKEAEQLDVQVLEARKRVLGEDHPETLMSMNNLANTYWNQGRFKEAEQLGVQVVEARNRVLGKDHPDTLQSVNNLAAYRSQGRLKEAGIGSGRVGLGGKHPAAVKTTPTAKMTRQGMRRCMIQ
jgi:tetratricopeptide (TPR) repeat protein